MRPEDHQLTFLFERHRNGAVTLTPDRRELLLSRLPGINRLRHLLTNEPSPYAREDDVFLEVVVRQLHQAGDRLPLRNAHRHGEDAYNMELGRLGISANILSYPKDIPSVGIDRRYWLPGDGRVWERTAWVSLRPAPGPIGPGQSDYGHHDPDIAAMQLGVENADRMQSSDIGCPLSPPEAWGIIHHLENLQ